MIKDFPKISRPIFRVGDQVCIEDFIATGKGIRLGIVRGATFIFSWTYNIEIAPHQYTQRDERAIVKVEDMPNANQEH